MPFGREHPCGDGLEYLFKRLVKGVDGYKPIFWWMIVTPAFNACRMNPNMTIRGNVNPNLKAFSGYAGDIDIAYLRPLP
ncbi:MAG: hypothetical protein B7Z67_12840 [Acidiphilium sp. 21-60-14]|nr:MAG: hypothetical protein B7Z67_12840 [Acidiphilium sp. 21-60-14]OYV89227.1 MAG: hypothetical protein B7Z57_13425 [Acidiphilium sp. 37-60-79]OZB40155.1 MAG: hypothetical protein B7X48_06210 [Acidiphilium sp. 34-60-192]